MQCSPDRTEFAKEFKEVVGLDVVVEILDEKRAETLLADWHAASGGRATTHRFTSGASLPPRLIAWIQDSGFT
jgi:hypothetical protein